LSFFDKMTKKESEEQFVTNIFQDLVLPRGPVFSVKVQTFHSDPDDRSSDSSLSSIRIDQCKSVQVKGPISSVEVQKFNPNFGKLNFLEDPNDDMKQSDVKIDESEYVNLVCQTSFGQIRNLKFECPSCDDEFKQIADLTQHMICFHPEPVIKLTIQRKSFESKPRPSKVKNCSKEMKKYHCSTCGSEFSSKYTLKRHEKSIHQGKRMYECWENTCDYKSNRKCDLLKHFTRMHETRGKKSIESLETGYNVRPDHPFLSRGLPKGLHF